MKAYLEIVKFNNDVVTASPEQPTCECYVTGFVSLNAAEDDC